MLAIVVSIAAALGLAWGFWAAVRRYSPVELSYWHAFGVLFIAGHASRLVSAAAANLDVFTRIGITLGVYVVVLTCDLAVIAKLSIGRSLVLATAYALVATAVFFLIVAYLLPAGAGRGPK